MSLTRPRAHAMILQPFEAAASIYRQRLVPSPRSLAQVRDDKSLSEVWFTSARPNATPLPTTDDASNAKPPDERTLKLGKSRASNIITWKKDLKANVSFISC